LLIAFGGLAACFSQRGLHATAPSKQSLHWPRQELSLHISELCGDFPPLISSTYRYLQYPNNPQYPPIKRKPSRCFANWQMVSVNLPLVFPTPHLSDPHHQASGWDVIGTAASMSTEVNQLGDLIAGSRYPVAVYIYIIIYLCNSICLDFIYFFFHRPFETISRRSCWMIVSASADNQPSSVSRDPPC
jgi:hypothetical protein